MSNANQIQENTTRIITNNTSIDALLDIVNNLPTATEENNPNLFTQDMSQIGYAGEYIKNNGYSISNVLWSDLTKYTGQTATWYVTNPIEIESNTWYKYEGFNSANNPGCCFLGADKVTIYTGVVWKGSGVFCTPAEAKYILMTVASANIQTMDIRKMTALDLARKEIDGLVDRTLSGNYINNRITLIGTEGLRATQITGLHCENVTNVGGEAVRQCNYLVNVYLPKCTNLSGYSFGICPLLETVELGAVTNIRAYDFYNCPKLKTLIINNTTSVCALANVSAFTGSGVESGTGFIYVPNNLVSSYKTATNWSTYASQIKSINEL
jgi:hypothetical protein